MDKFYALSLSWLKAIHFLCSLIALAVYFFHCHACQDVPTYVYHISVLKFRPVLSSFFSHSGFVLIFGLPCISLVQSCVMFILYCCMQSRIHCWYCESNATSFLKIAIIGL